VKYIQQVGVCAYDDYFHCINVNLNVVMFVGFACNHGFFNYVVSRMGKSTCCLL
jgi:hypothetical protein